MDDLVVALHLADLADDITSAQFRDADLRVSTKSDRSPVTEVDLAVQRTLTSTLSELRPHDGVLAEESDGPTPTSDSDGRRWIIDPLDHTIHYVRGLPTFASLVALEVNGEVTVGVVSAPAMGRRWWAQAGLGSFVNGRRIHVSSTPDIESAYVTFAALSKWRERGLADALSSLAADVRCTLGSGGFLGQMHVAEGKVDVSLDPWGKPWDLAASKIIVEQAGGRFSDLADDETIDQNVGIVTNGALHQAVLKYFA